MKLVVLIVLIGLPISLGINHLLGIDSNYSWITGLPVGFLVGFVLTKLRNKI